MQCNTQIGANNLIRRWKETWLTKPMSVQTNCSWLVAQKQVILLLTLGQRPNIEEAQICHHKVRSFSNYHHTRLTKRADVPSLCANQCIVVVHNNVFLHLAERELTCDFLISISNPWGVLFLLEYIQSKLLRQLIVFKITFNFSLAIFFSM